MTHELTPYERKAKQEIEVWREQPPGQFAKRLGQLSKPLDKVMMKVTEQRVIERALHGVMNVVLDGVEASLSEARVLDSYRKMGYELDRLEDIRTTVSLEDMDRQAFKLAKIYRAMLTAEGGGAGLAANFPPAAVYALAGDVVTITTVGTRAATHYAMTYGFRVESPHERALVLSVMNGATSPDMAMKQAALAEVAQVAKMVVQKKAWEELDKKLLVKSIKEATNKYIERLTKAKLGQVLAVIGFLVGGAYNAWYMTRLGEWGYYTYRDLHIKDKELRLAEPQQLRQAEPQQLRQAEQQQADASDDAPGTGPVVDAEVVDDEDDDTNESGGRR